MVHKERVKIDPEKILVDIENLEKMLKKLKKAMERDKEKGIKYPNFLNKIWESQYHDLWEYLNIKSVTNRKSVTNYEDSFEL